MRQLVKNYIFDKVARAVTLSDFATGVDHERLYLITNVTRSRIIYQFNSSTLGGSVSGNVVSLICDTSGMSNADKLQIIYDYDYVAPGEDVSTGSLRTRALSSDISGTASANNSDIVPSTDVSAYKWGSIQLSGTFSATITVQGSNDNSNWVSVGASNLSAVSQQLAVSISAVGMYAFPISYKYLRIRTTAFTSGTVVGNGQLYSLPSFPTSIGAAVTQQATFTVSPSSATGASIPTTAQYAGMLGQDGNLIGFRSAEVDAVTVGSLRVNPYLYNGTNSDRQRTLSTVKNVFANSSGNTTLWTPAAGKKFRILGFKVMATNNVAVASGGTLDIRLFDGASTSIGLSHTIYCPATAVTSAAGAAFDSGWIDLKNGYLSAAANNVLSVNLSLALTAGGIQTMVVGTEE